MNPIRLDIDPAAFQELVKLAGGDEQRAARALIDAYGDVLLAKRRLKPPAPRTITINTGGEKVGEVEIGGK